MSRIFSILLSFLAFFLFSCNQENKEPKMKIIFLHHSTGKVIWQGNKDNFAVNIAEKISSRVAEILRPKGQLPSLFKKFNKVNGTNYNINEISFPKNSPYGWKNYVYDYYNIWIRNAGDTPFMEEPTLEMLTKDYQVIIFKHCFPVSNILADSLSIDLNSEVKTLNNYKFQYALLKEKMLQFPDTKFIVWTGAAQVKSAITEDEAIRAKEFFKWIREEWDINNDNIYLWDFYELQTKGGLYFLEEYARSSTDSHPNKNFAGKACRLLFNRIIDVIENNGNGTKVTGDPISTNLNLRI